MGYVAFELLICSLFEIVFIVCFELPMQICTFIGSCVLYASVSCFGFV